MAQQPEEDKYVRTMTKKKIAAAWNSFESVENPTNDSLHHNWTRSSRTTKRNPTNDPMAATYIGFKMWTQAVAQAGTTGCMRRQAMYGQKVKAPSASTGFHEPTIIRSEAGDDRRSPPDGQFDRGVEDPGGGRSSPTLEPASLR